MAKTLRDGGASGSESDREAGIECQRSAHLVFTTFFRALLPRASGGGPSSGHFRQSSTHDGGSRWGWTRLSAGGGSERARRLR